VHRCADIVGQGELPEQFDAATDDGRFATGDYESYVAYAFPPTVVDEVNVERAFAVNNAGEPRKILLQVSLLIVHVSSGFLPK
jgi:hypothetical protein